VNWNVEFAPAAIRGLDRLPPKAAAAVVEFATITLPSNPERMSKPLSNELEGLRSARRGDYRIVFSLNELTSVLLIVRIAHRANVYRPA
jgi:mRNA interferase RelE/StbE